jgi:phosphotransacetylase
VSQAAAATEAAVLDTLRRTPRHAELVSRLMTLLTRRSMEREQVEQALADLQTKAAILVREHYCADPHLATADLRVAAIVEPTENHDPVADAAKRIEGVWQRWLSDYLSNHTCV